MSLLKRLSKSFLQGPAYILLFGLIFFGIGGGLTLQQRIFERQGAQAQGEVVSLLSRCNDDWCSYSPVVRFETQAGDTITFTTIHSSKPPAYDVGERVTVIYPLEDPEKAIIKDQGGAFRIVFMAVGGLVILIGMLIYYYLIQASYVRDLVKNHQNSS
jgi:hypothetical protein